MSLAGVRLLHLPRSGQVLVGHPDQEEPLSVAALINGIPYFLSELVEAGTKQLYLIDMDHLGHHPRPPF